MTAACGVTASVTNFVSLQTGDFTTETGSATLGIVFDTFPA